MKKTSIGLITFLCPLALFAAEPHQILQASIRNPFAQQYESIEVLSDGEVQSLDQSNQATTIGTLSPDKLVKVEALIDGISTNAVQVKCVDADTEPHSSALMYAVTNSNGQKVTLKQAPFSGVCQNLNDPSSFALVRLADVIFSLNRSLP